MANKEKKIKHRKEFSKWLLIQESWLIWIVTISFIVLAFVCVYNQYFGELPWLAAMVGFPWAAYGASSAFYYKKAEKENTANGIYYETTLAELEAELERRRQSDNDNNTEG